MTLCCKRKLDEITSLCAMGDVDGDLSYPHCRGFDEWSTQDNSRSSERDKKEATRCYKANALVVWPSIYAKLKQKNRRIAVFLDYDGTLTPIVDTPSKAVLTSSMREVVQLVSEKFSTAIVTGRKIDTIYNFVQLNSLYYAGSHGFDIRGVQNSPMKKVAKDFRPLLLQCYKELLNQLEDYSGSLIEDNEFYISVHYRKVSPGLVPALEKLVDKQIEKCSNKLIKKNGKMVFEIRPQIDWNKGKAVKWLLQYMFEGKTKKKKGESLRFTTLFLFILVMISLMRMLLKN